MGLLAIKGQIPDGCLAVLIGRIDDTSRDYLVLTADGKRGLHSRSGGVEARINGLEMFDGKALSRLMGVVFVGSCHAGEGLIGVHCVFWWFSVLFFRRELEFVL